MESKSAAELVLTGLIVVSFASSVGFLVYGLLTGNAVVASIAGAGVGAGIVNVFRMIDGE